MITVEDILMGKGPEIIVATSSTTVLDAARLMAKDKIGSIVIRDEGKVLGIFTERDLLCRVVAEDRDPKSLVLSDVMSSPVNACRLSDDIRTCARILSDTNTRHLVVVEQETLMGLISLRDVQAARAQLPWSQPSEDPSDIVIPVFYDG
jgi:CBS domain-containing protein